MLKEKINSFCLFVFGKFKDPIYVKIEKLNVMILLTSQSNIAQVLAELKEYTTEVDVDSFPKMWSTLDSMAPK